MKPTLPTHRGRAGYSIIELLVVLVIISILAAVGFNTMGPKSPRAVKANLQAIRGFLQEARYQATLSGRELRLTTSMNIGAQTATLSATDDQGNLVKSLTLEKSALKQTTLTTSSQALPATSPAITSLEAAKTYKFGSSGAGWANHLFGSSTITFTPSGTVISKTSAGVRSGLAGGFWVGVFGKDKNKTGVPCGAILVTEEGKIIAFYKPDASETSSEYLWQRME